MSDQIKNRVVGAIVLVALAIVFIPKVFDGEKQSQHHEFVAIPKQPIQQITQPAPQASNETKTTPTDEILSLDTVETNVKPATDNVVKPVIVKATSEDTAVEVTKASAAITKTSNDVKPASAWVIRMGTFGNPTNANVLVKKLRQKGFTAFSVPRVAKAGVSNKVFIGPELTKSLLVNYQPQLKRDFKEGGVIEKYNPLQ